MKYRYCFLLLFFLSLSFAAAAQGVGVGTTTPAASAALDVTSTTQGLLLPRMTAVQRAAIASPALGLFVFQTDGTPGLYYFMNTAWVNMANGLVPDANGNTARVNTLAGSSTPGTADGTGTAAQFSGPSGVGTDGNGNLYVTDYTSSRIRKIVIATGVVTTLAGSSAGFADGTGTAAKFSNPNSVAGAGLGNLYVADQSNQRIRKIVIATGVVSTLAGSGTSGYVDGPAAAAQFNSLQSVVVDGNGTIYTAEYSNSHIRVIK